MATGSSLDQATTRNTEARSGSPVHPGNPALRHLARVRALRRTQRGSLTQIVLPTCILRAGEPGLFRIMLSDLATSAARLNRCGALGVAGAGGAAVLLRLGVHPVGQADLREALFRIRQPGGAAF